jgi:hypothetical protein
MWYNVTFDFKYPYRIWAQNKESAIKTSFIRFQKETGKTIYSHVDAEIESYASSE